MARYRSGRSGRYKSNSSHKKRGVDYAMEHIAQARALSVELGGTDRDVKEYFFSLSPKQLAPILEEYRALYGDVPHDYAVEALPRWKAGEVQMSGLVASRLFSLLPKQMPLEAKYKLTENLWRNLGPKSIHYVTAGYNASIDDIMTLVEQKIQEVVQHFRIPENLERRFDWLSEGDVQLKQKILCHLQEQEKCVATAGCRAQIASILQHLQSEHGRFTQRAVHTVRVGNHQVVVTFVPHQLETVFGQPAATANSSEIDYVFIISIIVLLALGTIVYLNW